MGFLAGSFGELMEETLAVLVVANQILLCLKKRESLDSKTSGSLYG